MLTMKKCFNWSSFSLLLNMKQLWKLEISLVGVKKVKLLCLLQKVKVCIHIFNIISKFIMATKCHNYFWVPHNKFNIILRLHLQSWVLTNVGNGWTIFSHKYLQFCQLIILLISREWEISLFKSIVTQLI